MSTAATNETSVEETIKSWPDTPKKAAQVMIERYGVPEEITPQRAIWHGNGPWKRSVITAEEIPHQFPKPHKDCLEQVIDYRVPVDKADELVGFDGSVIIERTKGELSARCDKEEMNFLALNLAHDVATGRRGVDEARRAYTEKAMAWMMKRTDDERYTEGLHFDVPRGGTADPDEVTIDDTMMHRVREALGGEPIE